jgi:putative membrane protein insertion efficiency factor
MPELERKESETRSASVLHPGWRIGAGINAAIGLILTGLVRMYQWTLSPLIYALFGRVCRFEPSCSQYFIDAVRKYGPWKGTLKGIWRICRCNPFCEGGHDPA